MVMTQTRSCLQLVCLQISANADRFKTHMNEADEQGRLRWRFVYRAEMSWRAGCQHSKAELGQEVEEMHKALLWQIS